MIFLFYLIKAKISVIIIGETGCGKTSLIIKLSQILNKWEKSVEIININPDITIEKIINFMREMNIKSLEDNIRLNGAYNPYRLRKENNEIFGLTREDDGVDKFLFIKLKNYLNHYYITYLVLEH